MNHIQHYIQSLGKSDKFILRGKNEFDFDHCKQAYIQISKSIVTDWIDKDPNLTDQIVHYCIGSEKFKGDLNKGIIFMGSTGTGKTVILKAMSMLLGYMVRFRFLIYTGWEMERVYMIADQVNNEKYKLEQALNAKMLGIDDLGEEHTTIKVYGSDINVGIESLTKRHLEYVNKGHLTFITTNLNADLIASKYGARIESRLYEMCNMIGVKGNDMRKATDLTSKNY